MKAITKSVMIASQDKVGSRKNSCAIYGFDFMIDSNFNVWLIEINGSPAMPFNRVNNSNSLSLLMALRKIHWDLFIQHWKA